MTSNRPDPRGLPVDVRDVGVRFTTPGGGVDALAGCSLEVGAGSFTVVIGPNGSGKSTLLRLVAGLLAPTSGSVSVGGDRPRPGDGRVGLAFQQPRLVAWRSTLDNVALPLEIAGVPLDQRRRRAGDALERVGLAAAADLRPRELSGGMAQRAALARALIGDPPVLLLDEPFSALDEFTRESINMLFMNVCAETRAAALLVTHSVQEAVLMSDRVFVMSGRPARVVDEVEISIPRPRSRHVMVETAFVDAVKRIRSSLGLEDAQESSVDDPP